MQWAPNQIEMAGRSRMQTEARSGRSESVAPRPLAELLQCPPSIGNLLNRSAQSFNFEAGDIVFHQSDHCVGLYLIVSGQFQRRTDRLKAHLVLGQARSGDLVELAAALGDERHTYTLAALSTGSVLMLPIEALHRAFDAHPPLRRQLLEELAREVSRGYAACCHVRVFKPRRGGSLAAAD
jgi:CRP-like cAMP-binding protein